MQILFLHNNFPAQFGGLAIYLSNLGWDVWFGTQRKGSSLAGIKTFFYEPHRKVTEKIHPYASSFENAVLNGQALVRSATKLKTTHGLNPDIVVAHSGWGPGLFVKDIWPRTKYVGYFEWFYRNDAPDVEFLNEDERNLDDQLRGRMRNAPILLDLEQCDIGICPTKFQAAQFPDLFSKKMKVLHDGVDTEIYRGNDEAKFSFNERQFTRDDEIVTYVARGMEPYRGFMEFMRAVEIVCERREKTQFIIVGEDRVAYGRKLPSGDSYKKRALTELNIDLERVHFTGLLPRNDYLSVLQVSRVHTYLTIPFVLSWSMMEAMSAECALVASDNAPVREMIINNKHGRLTDNRNPEAIADAIIELLDDTDARKSFGASARKRIKSQYDAQKMLEQRKILFEDVVTGRA